MPQIETYPTSLFFRFRHWSERDASGAPLPAAFHGTLGEAVVRDDGSVLLAGNEEPKSPAQMEAAGFPLSRLVSGLNEALAAEIAALRAQIAQERETHERALAGLEEELGHARAALVQATSGLLRHQPIEAS